MSKIRCELSSNLESKTTTNEKLKTIIKSHKHAATHGFKREVDEYEGNGRKEERLKSVEVYKIGFAKYDISKKIILGKQSPLPIQLSLIHICRCRRYAVCRSRWSPYH
eukprot:TRINITY_DN18926_c0_g1_i1.p1 TRINITY_DN18926_c0_g1~~TRINITY_DN18926_c0_g1_i1.p1  ORF type:complete len:108 (+),score=34.03 TRINITY_DN18926_c0_g1_i1:102-425(+)